MPLKSSSILYTSQGKPITLGKKLGEGGEGYVCAVNALPQQVAKIYHIKHLPDADKQAKLRYMIANVNQDLLKYTAWATDTLHKHQGGRIIGFLMPKIVDCNPIHTLYNPSFRRQNHPKFTWKFLFYTARNLASAIHSLHKMGHVIGDINQGNLLFAKDSKVMLIDTDSFQISTPTTTHLSLVGVAHFTPPERQGNTNFDSLPRTQNHDNFGLAVLIFHLLFGGRHPYAGVPLIKEAGNLLEHDIKAYRYAYAPDHVRRGIKPPPASIPIDIIPKKLQSLFIQAFTEKGAQQRPTAKTWLDTLDAVRIQIKTCRHHRQHEYSNHLVKCPWCELEKKGVIYFGEKTQNNQKNNHTNHIKNIENLKQACHQLPDYDVSDILPKFSQFLVTATPFKKAEKTDKPLFNINEPDWLSNPPFDKTSIIGRLLNILLQLIIFLILICILFTYPLLVTFGFLFTVIAMGFIFYYWLQVPTKYTAWMGNFYVFLGIVICFSPIWYFVTNRILTKSRYEKEKRNRKVVLDSAVKKYVQAEKEIEYLDNLIRNYAHEKNKLLTVYKKFQDMQHSSKHQQTPATYADIVKTMEKHWQRIQNLQQKIKTEQARHNLQDYQNLAIEVAQAQADYKVMIES